MFFLKLLSLTHSGGKMFLRYTGMESPRLSDGAAVLLTVNKFPSQFVTHEYIQISNIDIIIYTSMRPHTHTQLVKNEKKSRKPSNGCYFTHDFISQYTYSE